MITRRKIIIALGAGALTAPLTCFAQPAAKTPRVGMLYPGPQSAVAPRVEAFTDGLRAGGYVAPAQIDLVLRVAGGDPSKIAPFAEEIVKSNVDVIFAIAAPATLASRAATKTIPIVSLDLETDPVVAGLATSLGRPGGNVTGMFFDFPDFTTKWLELLKEIIPKLARVAVIWDPSTGQTQIQAIEGAARKLKIKLTVIEVRKPPEFESAFASAKKQGAQAMIILSAPVFGGNTQKLAELALREKIPAVTMFPSFAREGGLLAYGPNLLGIFRQAGVMVAKVLKGAKPAELAIERPSKYEFVVNQKTAKALGLTIPASILVRADEVIE